MKTNCIVPVICAFVATGIAACSGDSQPTGPASAGALNRPSPYVTYAGSSTGADTSGSQSQTSDGGTLAPQPDPPGPVNGNPAPGSGGGRAAGGGGQGAGSGDTGPGSGGGRAAGGGGQGAGGGQQAIVHPIQEFLQAQGSFCVDDGSGGCRTYGGPVANYLAWFDRSQNVTMAIDYAGIVSRWAQQNGWQSGAQIDGSVSEQPMADGSSRYTVELKGAGISSYAVEGTNLASPIRFGVRPMEMGDPMATSATGDLRMTITFTQRAGMLPDLVQLLRAPREDQKLVSINFDYSARGLMRDPASPEMGGKDGTVNVRFDGSQGSMMSSNPYDGSNTAPTGYTDMSFTTYATQ